MVQCPLNAILKSWFPHPPEKIAIAVSGGVDSMALTYGLHQWANQHGKTQIIPMIVDHGLRANSEREAHQVAHWLKEWGLDPIVLRWMHCPMNTGLMEKARSGRYATLAMACHQRDIPYLFLGHHQDDMLETVWMREKMNGSARGFAGISSVTMRYGVILLRPFLHIPKAELEEWMRICHVLWVHDPTNDNLAFHRTHARQCIQSWTEKIRTHAWKHILERGHERFFYEKTLATMCTLAHHPGYILIQDFHPLLTLSTDAGCLWIQCWMYSFSFGPIAGLSKQKQLWQRLCSFFQSNEEKCGKILATFAGCIFVRDHEKLWIFREYSRIADGPVCAQTVFWDDRVFSRIPQILQRSKDNSSGFWKDRFIRAGLPHQWNDKTMMYRPCGWPYPHFSIPTQPIQVTPLF